MLVGCGQVGVGRARSSEAGTNRPGSSAPSLARVCAWSESNAHGPAATRLSTWRVCLFTTSALNLPRMPCNLIEAGTVIDTEQPCAPTRSRTSMTLRPPRSEHGASAFPPWAQKTGVLPDLSFRRRRWGSNPRTSTFSEWRCYRTELQRQDIDVSLRLGGPRSGHGS